MVFNLYCLFLLRTKYVTTQITTIVNSSRTSPTPAMEASSNALGLYMTVTDSVVVGVPNSTICMG